MPLLRSAFIALSRNRPLRHFCENSSLGVRLSSRFIAGMEIADALRVAEAVNQQGMAVTLDSLGESVTSETEAHRAADIYHQLLDMIAARKLNANISVKLTQMGLELIPVLAETIAWKLAEHARARATLSASTWKTQSSRRSRSTSCAASTPGPSRADAMGVVIQAYLYRSQADVEQLIAEGIRVRLCKGAYKEPAEVAFPRKADVDANYIRLGCMLLDSPIYHGLATHDEAMVAAIKAHAAKHGIEPSRFEFQMLYGIRRDLQRKLVQEGYKVRVYVPFGADWYPYFMRRLAERPANVIFLARNFFRS